MPPDLTELRDLLARHAGQTALDGVTVLSSITPSEPMTGLLSPTLVVVAQGSKRTTIADQVLTYGAGDYLIVSLDLPVVAHVEQASRRSPYLVVGVPLRSELIAELVLHLPSRAVQDGPGFAVGHVAGDLLDPLVRLLRLLDRPADIPVLAAGIERELVWRLLTGEQGPTVRAIGLSDSSLARIGRAISWIRANYTDLFRVEDAARVAGMSATSFHRHFRTATTMSPLQFQKQLRLQEARTRLLADPHGVAEVGFAVGYESVSQFTREYRRLFGLPPGQDALRLRRVPPVSRQLI